MFYLHLVSDESSNFILFYFLIIISSLFRDFHRLLDSHGQLTKRLDDVLIENNQLKEALLESQSDLEKAKAEAHSLDSLNQDLGAQVQHLLKKNYEKGASFSSTSSFPFNSGSSDKQSAGNIISDYLVAFDDIKELQTRNTQLLKVVRKLSEDQENIENKTMTGDKEFESLKASLEASNRELNTLREARIRTEEMVLGLVQQRDMYRTMVEESEKTYGSQGLLTASPAGKNVTTVATLGENTPSKTLELQKNIAQVKILIFNIKYFIFDVIFLITNN